MLSSEGQNRNLGYSSKLTMYTQRRDESSKKVQCFYIITFLIDVGTILQIKWKDVQVSNFLFTQGIS